MSTRQSTNAAPDEEQQTLESSVPLSQSLIWRLQRDFYTDRGPKVWTEDMVPHYVTNNPSIAETYAEIVFHFLEDCGMHDASSNDAVMRILELGAGSGKFSYLFLRRIASLLSNSGIPLTRIHYCMTDCAENIIEGWRNNSWLAEFSQQGILEFALLRAGDESALQPASNSPLVVIANYVFDSLPQDAFVVKDGAIFEAVVTTTAPAKTQASKDTQETEDEDKEDKKDATRDLSRLKFSYSNVAVAEGRYPDQRWNDILEHYRRHLPAATLAFPRAEFENFAGPQQAQLMDECWCWPPIRAMPTKISSFSLLRCRLWNCTTTAVFPRW